MWKYIVAWLILWISGGLGIAYLMQNNILLSFLTGLLWGFGTTMGLIALWRRNN